MVLSVLGGAGDVIGGVTAGVAMVSLVMKLVIVRQVGFGFGEDYIVVLASLVMIVSESRCCNQRW